MKLEIFFMYITFIVWLILAVRHRKNEYFLFFWVFAIGDPIKVTLQLCFHIHSSTLLILFVGLIACVLMKPGKMRTAVFVFSAAVSILFFGLKVPQIYYNVIASILHLFVLSLLILQFTERFVRLKSLNLFLMILIFYQTINFFKRISMLIYPPYGTIGFYLGYAFQMVPALLFLFIDINTKDFKLSKYFPGED